MNINELNLIFNKKPGYVDLRYIKPRDVAFVEFEDEIQSELALKSLKDFKFENGISMDINFSKKKGNN